MVPLYRVRTVAAVAALAVIGIAGCGEGEVVSGPHGLPISTSACSSERGGNWPTYSDRVAWHPEGTEVYFSIRAPHAAIYAVATDGGGLRTIARTGPTGVSAVGPPTTFAVSPDGAHLVYATCAYRDRPEAPESERPTHFDYVPELARVQADGSHDIRLTENSGIDDYPAWSPDGSRIAFLSSRAEAGGLGPRLHMMAVDGSEVRPIYRAPGVIVPIVAQHPPQWSPDGQHLAFLRIEGRKRHAIYTVRADGADLKQLTAAVSGPSWSPDGQRLAFAKPDGNEIALYTIAADGTDARWVTTIPRKNWIPRSGEPDLTQAWIQTVAWSPDGSKIFYTCRGICVVELDGTPTSELPLPGDSAAWSPDGSRIATVSTSRHDLSRGQSDVLRTMAPDGSDLRVLVRLNATGMFRVTDGRQAAGAADTTGCRAGIAVANPAEHPGLVADCETLLVLQASLTGSGKLGWKTDRPLSAWDGVKVGGAPLRVEGLSLAERSLWGELPPELGRLTALTTLSLYGNQLTGAILPELGRLSQLTVLSLSHNQLTGPIPVELGELAKLTHLVLDFNRLTGAIPAELSQLVNLNYLDLSVNRLTEAIPAELGQLVNLNYLDLSSNDLTGPIPRELGQLVNLEELDLGNNSLIGPIPAELGQLTSLDRLILAQNQLTGSIPPELGRLKGLVWLEGNQLTGCLPSGLSVSDRDRVGLPVCDPG